MFSTGSLSKHIGEIQTAYFVTQDWSKYIAETTSKAIEKVDDSLMPIYDLETSEEFEPITVAPAVLEKDISEMRIATAEIYRPKEFITISECPKLVDLTDLVKNSTQKKVIPPILVKKLKSILKDIQEMEPELYKSLLRTNQKIDLEEIISFLNFVGVEKLPGDFDIETLFEELKLVHSHG